MDGSVTITHLGEQKWLTHIARDEIIQQ